LGLTGDHLTFLGASDNVPAQLDAADYLVFTSDDEGLPNAVLEAMAAGLPVITTAAGDAARVVQHGVSGFVVEHGEPEQIARHMVQLAASPEMAQTMGRAGRAYVARHYAASLLRDRLLTIYQTVARRASADRVLPLIPLCSGAA
jgi:glycosyltransferase involved in cell wall biosynthesis